MVAEVAPVLHKYVPPPVAVNVLLNPSHTVLGLAVAVALGAGKTVTVVVVEAVQPLALVAVTVYVVVIVGDTITVALVAPVLHRYVCPPDTDNCVLWPAQMVEGKALAVGVGTGLTVTVAVAVLVQPFAAVTVTV